MRILPASPSDLAVLLSDRGLLDAASFVDGDLRVEQESRRHRVSRVLPSAGSPYFVKQAGSTRGAPFIAREAAFYQAVASDEAYASLRRYLAGCHGFDEASGVLVLELLAGYENLREYHRRRGRFPVSTARRLGEALGRIHNETMPLSGASAFSAEAPWILSLHRPPLHVLDELSQGSIELIETVQRFPELGSHLDALRQGWARRSLVHFDLAWENCLAGPGEIKIVDWELCGAGDPLWDAGSVLAAYLAFWVESMPVEFSIPAGSLPGLARYPLAAMQPAMRAFWDAYAMTTKLDAAAGPSVLEKTVGYCAARLLEHAYAGVQAARTTSALALVLTQLSFNLLKQPLSGGESVLGISLEGAP